MVSSLAPSEFGGVEKRKRDYLSTTIAYGFKIPEFCISTTQFVVAVAFHSGLLYIIGLKQSGYGKDISHLSLRDYYDIRRITIKR